MAAVAAAAAAAMAAFCHLSFSDSTCGNANICSCDFGLYSMNSP